MLVASEKNAQYTPGTVNKKLYAIKLSSQQFLFFFFPFCNVYTVMYVHPAAIVKNRLRFKLPRSVIYFPNQNNLFLLKTKIEEHSRVQSSECYTFFLFL